MALPYGYSGSDPGRSGRNIGSGGMMGGGLGGGGGIGGGVSSIAPWSNTPSLGELIYKYRRQYPGLGWKGLGRDDTQNLESYQGFEQGSPSEYEQGQYPGMTRPQILQRLSDTSVWVRGLQGRGSAPYLGGSGSSVAYRNASPSEYAQGQVRNPYDSPLQRLLRWRSGRRNPFEGVVNEPGPGNDAF